MGTGFPGNNILTQAPGGAADFLIGLGCVDLLTCRGKVPKIQEELGVMVKFQGPTTNNVTGTHEIPHWLTARPQSRLLVSAVAREEVYPCKAY